MPIDFELQQSLSWVFTNYQTYLIRNRQYRNYYFQKKSRSNAVVRTIRTIKKGEEILDNYGYHYAVMSREERQRKL